MSKKSNFIQKCGISEWASLIVCTAVHFNGDTFELDWAGPILLLTVT